MKTQQKTYIFQTKFSKLSEVLFQEEFGSTGRVKLSVYKETLNRKSAHIDIAMPVYSVTAFFQFQ
jgi:hypothetical protein